MRHVAMCTDMLQEDTDQHMQSQSCCVQVAVKAGCDSSACLGRGHQTRAPGREARPECWLTLPLLAERLSTGCLAGS